MNLRTLNVLVALICAVACNPEKNETEADASSGDEGASEGTVGMSSTPTTGEGGLTTGGSVGATEGGMEGTDEGPGETGPGETGQAFGVCEAFCDKGPMCGLEPGGAACVEFCEMQIDGVDAACGAASEALFECVVDMTCEEFLAFVNGEDPGPCLDEGEAQEDACQGSMDECEVGAGGDIMGTECEWTKMCPDTMTVTMHCDTEACTCMVGEEMVGMCDAEGICAELDGIEDKAAVCCGF